ncbi:hypothetical protein WB44_08265 [Synechococcus sp. WH 8020]|nr:hypothetical protein WB44_08265 [Synechococcus sp. WH 8020]
MKTLKRLLPFALIALLMSCDSQGARDQQTCALYNADQIDAVEALKRLGLQPKNGQRFEPVERACAHSKKSS